MINTLVRGLVFSLLLSFPAFSQNMCGERHVVVRMLYEEYGETVQSVGLAGNRILETYASEDTGTWTILMTMPDGVSCLMASGSHYERVTEGQRGDPT